MAAITGAAVVAAAEAAKVAAESAATLAAEAAAAEAKKLAAEKLAELATTEGLKKATVQAAARTAGTAAQKSAKKKMAKKIEEKNSGGKAFSLTAGEKLLIECFREADLITKKQVIDLLKEYIDGDDLLVYLLGGTEPTLEEALAGAVKKHFGKEEP